MKDYYLILGVPRHASEGDIRQAHRRLVLKHHPDCSGRPDPARFREVQEAYEVLRDPGTREQHNRALNRRERASRSHGRPVHGGPIPLWEEFRTVLPGMEEILDHIRGDFFGPTRKVDALRALNVEFILSPDEAASGGRVPLDVPVYVRCPSCSGRGGAFPFPCLRCDGKGWRWSRRELEITIPPKVADGTVYRIPLRRLGIEHLYLNVSVRVER